MSLKRSFAKNSMLNLVTQGLVIVVAFVCVPVVVRRLGAERFGLLSILWLFTGYFSLLDLGIGLASVKFLSEHLAKEERVEAAGIARLATRFNLILGAVGCIVVLAVAAIGIQHVLNVSAGLEKDAQKTLVLLAFCVPAVLLQSTLRSIPLAFHRFDLVNMLQGGSGIAQWVGSVITVILGGGLLQVVILTVAIRYAMLGCSVVFAWRLLPEVFSSSIVPRAKLSVLLRFGGWVTVAQVVSPIIVFIERLFIGNCLSLAWVSYFTVPNDAIMKLGVIPLSLASTLLPAVSGSWWNADTRAAAKNAYVKSIKFTYLLLIPVAAIAIAFHREILLLWLGEEFALKSGLVLCFFGVGIIFYCVSQIPSVTLQALGRPDIAAKLLLIELPLYAAAVYLLTTNFGINGTAFAWMTRVGTETLVLLIGTHITMRSVKMRLNNSYLWKALAVLVPGVLGVVLVKSYLGEGAAIGVSVAAALVYAPMVWFTAFDRNDKEAILRVCASFYQPQLP